MFLRTAVGCVLFPQAMETQVVRVQLDGPLPAYNMYMGGVHRSP